MTAPADQSPTPTMIQAWDARDAWEIQAIAEIGHRPLDFDYPDGRPVVEVTVPDYVRIVAPSEPDSYPASLDWRPGEAGAVYVRVETAWTLAGWDVTLRCRHRLAAGKTSRVLLAVDELAGVRS